MGDKMARAIKLSWELPKGLPENITVKQISVYRGNVKNEDVMLMNVIGATETQYVDQTVEQKEAASYKYTVHLTYADASGKEDVDVPSNLVSVELVNTVFELPALSVTAEVVDVPEATTQTVDSSVHAATEVEATHNEATSQTDTTSPNV